MVTMTMILVQMMRGQLVSEGLGKRKSGEASRKRSSGHRCRRCGHECASSQWKAYHKNKVSDISKWKDYPQAWVLRNVSGNKVWENYTVPEGDFFFKLRW